MNSYANNTTAFILTLYLSQMYNFLSAFEKTKKKKYVLDIFTVQLTTQFSVSKTKGNIEHK